MKLLNCLVCHDIVKIDAEWAHCKCEKSCARYAPDNRHAEVFGPSRIIGIDNRDYAQTIKDPYFRPFWFVIREPNDRIYRHQERPNTDEESTAKPEDDIVPNKVYVGNLDESTNEDDLRHTFKDAGEIEEVRIIMNREGTCRGYAFIKFSTDQAAEEAIDKLNGVTIKGKEVVVKEVRNKQRSNDRPYYGHANKFRGHYNGAPNVQYRPKRGFRSGYANDPFNPFND